MEPQLRIEQKITAFTNIYKIFVNESGEKGELSALAQQKRIAFKEKVTFYADEQKSQMSFTFRAEKVLDVHGRYFVEDENGQMLGMFRKEFGKSLLNSTWVVMDADGNDLFTIRESNAVFAVLRRVIGIIPYIGDLFEILLMVLKYHFVFIDSKTGEQVGKYQKLTFFRDHYNLDMTDEAYSRIDWRVLAAMGVGLDALQSR